MPPPYDLPSLCAIFTGLDFAPVMPARHVDVPCRVWPDIRMWRSRLGDDEIVPWTHLLIIDDPLVLDGQSGHAPVFGPNPTSDWINVRQGDNVAYVAIFATTIWVDETGLTQQRILMQRVIGHNDAGTAG